MAPRYGGPLLIRRVRLDAPDRVRFHVGGPAVVKLRVPPAATRRRWHYLPTDTLFQTEGCYGFQIDGRGFSEKIVFRVLLPPAATRRDGQLRRDESSPRSAVRGRASGSGRPVAFWRNRMMPRLLLALPVCVLAVGCARGEGEKQASSHAKEGVSPAITTATALGLWSQRFVRLRSGEVVAVGFSRTPAGVALVRYLPSGRLDRSFGRHVWPQFGAGMLGALAAARQGDKVVVVACQPPDCWGYLVLARFHPDGRLDDAFGKQGFVRTAVPNADLTPAAIALQPDGKIVVAGELQRVPSSGELGGSFVARYHLDGQLDRDFGDNGIATPGDLERPGAVLVQPDGRILIGGANLIVRLLLSGNLDTTFGAGGAAAGLTVATLVRQRDGKIVAGGSGRSERSPVFALARLTPNGNLDHGFAASGHLLHRRRGDHWARVETLLPISSGRIVAVGWATRGTAVLKRRYRFVFLLLTHTGRLDPRFGNGGRRTIESISGQAIAAFRIGSRRLLAVGPSGDLRIANSSMWPSSVTTAAGMLSSSPAVLSCFTPLPAGLSDQLVSLPSLIAANSST